MTAFAVAVDDLAFAFGGDQTRAVRTTLASKASKRLLAEVHSDDHPGLAGILAEDLKPVDYSGLTGILVEAVKELKAQNEALRSRIESSNGASGAGASGATRGTVCQVSAGRRRR